DSPKLAIGTIDRAQESKETRTRLLGQKRGRDQEGNHTNARSDPIKDSGLYKNRPLHTKAWRGWEPNDSRREGFRTTPNTRRPNRDAENSQVIEGNRIADRPYLHKPVEKRSRDR